jgi:radical SAM superfamily enzyme YgiQ (UPF0313 family)
VTRLLDDSPFDIVAFGFVAGYYQYRVAKELAIAINRSKRRKQMKFVVGGHGPAAEPVFFQGKLGCDVVVVGDGEDLGWVDLPGGVYNCKPCESDEAPIGAYRDFPMDIYRLIRWPTSNRTDFCLPVLSSRGCRWHCSFCYRMRPGFHERSIEAIIDEVKFLHDIIQINHFQFSDELLMSSEKRTEAICQAILELPFKIKWDCNGRLNFAKASLLSLMRKSGCEYVNYGIESLNQDLLNHMHKGLTLDQIESGVVESLKSGLSPGLNLIWGFPGDSLENLTKAVQFISKYDPCHELRTIRPVTPYPGTELYRLAIEKGFLAGPEDFYEQKHLNSDLVAVNFTDIPTDEMHKALYRANKELYIGYQVKRAARLDRQMAELYSGKDANFRGFRDV